MTKNIHTLEDNFDYQIKEIVKEIKNHMGLEEVTDDDLWENRKLLGELVYSAINEYCGFEAVGIKEVDSY